MFGKIIIKYCTTCEKGVKVTISKGYWVGGNLYCVGFSCRTCGTDLCEEDRKVLEKAKKGGKDITEFMY